jgi:integrase
MRLFKRPSKPKKGQKQYYYARVRIDSKDVWISSKCEVGKVLKAEARDKILVALTRRKEKYPKSNVIEFRQRDRDDAPPPAHKIPSVEFSGHAPIREVAEEFVNRRKINNLNSWKEYLYLLNRFTDFVGPETSVRVIEFDTIDKFKEMMKESKRDTTINTYLSFLHKFFEDVKHVWHLREESSVNPVAVSGWITIKKENQEERVIYSDEEILALRDAALPHFLPWINLALKTSAREVELWKCHESHVSHANQNIWIPPSKTLRGRYVGLGPDGMEQMDRLLKETPDGYPLRNRNGDRYGNPGLVSTMFKKTRERAGLQRGSFHCLRHTAATRMLRAGKSLEEVQYVLGHKNILTTRIYIHSTEEAQKAALALDNL